MPILRVPKELKAMFDADPENFIRDIANFPQESVLRYFRNALMNYRSVTRSKINPFDFKTHKLSDDYRATEDYRRFLHFDLSLGGDLCAFAMGHTKSFVEVSSLDRGKLITLKLPYVEIDMIGILLVDQREEVWLPEITEIINDISRKGFNINLITFDRFQSAYLMQELRDQGYLTSLLSIDRTASYPIIDLDKEDRIARKTTEGNYIAAMACLKDTINHGRISVPLHKPIDRNTTETEFEIELKAAEYYPKKKKVDHPSNGRLDVIQAVAGVCFNIENNVRSLGENEGKDLHKDLADTFYNRYQSETELDDYFNKPRLEINNETFLG